VEIAWVLEALVARVVVKDVLGAAASAAVHHMQIVRLAPPAGASSSAVSASTRAAR